LRASVAGESSSSAVPTSASVSKRIVRAAKLHLVTHQPRRTSMRYHEKKSAKFDEELAKRPDDRHVVKFESGLRARSRSRTATSFAPLSRRWRRRIGDLLDQGHRVRII
jgi:hypothetical protein